VVGNVVGGVVEKLGFAQVEAAAVAVRERLGIKGTVKVGVVLGSGLGHVADVVVENGGKAIDYGAIPHFPTSAVEGHKGRLVFGKVDGTDVLLLQGRVHRYEGWDASAVVFPVRVLFALGVTHLFVTNAAGGIGAQLEPGDLMVVDDQLNLTGDNPLMGHNDGRFGVRFPDMSEAYSKRLRALADDVARQQGFALKHGVYAGLNGPTYETPAEVRMLQTLGADAVGMSTVYETIVANHQGVQVLGISCVTNLAAGRSTQKLSHDEVKETAERVGARFTALTLALIPRLAG
jgi:purine-nucleoside phosphorylase